jgi:DNA-binding LytR/AlgR family response regulator
MCQMHEMNLFRPSVTVDHLLSHDTNEISGRSTGVLDYLLKPVSDNSPLRAKVVYLILFALAGYFQKQKSL